jgi:hypothetical protein
MKRVVVTSESGNIIATAPHFDENYRSSDGGPNVQEIVPLSGQFVHLVEFPDGVQSAEALLAFHRTHRVRVTNGKAALEKI